MRSDLALKLQSVPKKPGVYLLKDKTGKILYVGKAKILNHRLRNHFTASPDLKHARMMSKVEDFDFVVTDSEMEALILEANFIKEHKPRYNVNLKDDKTYPYIRVTHELYPRVLVTRKIVRDGSRYFGPYTDVGHMRQLLSAIRRIFPIRSCNLHITEETIRNRKHKICLQFHIERCKGPCEGRISPEDYQAIVHQVIAFIEGKNHALVKDLTQRMEMLSREERFEEAAKVRDQIQAIARFQAKQKVVGEWDEERDLVVVAVDDVGGCGMVFDVRGGKIINRRHFYLEGVETRSESEVLSAFLKQYYLRADFIPREILIPMECEECAEIEQWLSTKKGAPVRIVIPKAGKEEHLMAMCVQNARLLLEELRIQKEKSADWIAPSVLALQRDLALPKIPKRIEAFDISNLFGQDAVGSMVCFENGKPLKSEYRKFKIRSIQGIDDFAMMAEVVERRIVRLINEGKPPPDLILIDGGKGQLSRVREVLRKHGIHHQPVIGLAKRLDEIFLPDFSDPQMLPKDSPSLRLLQRIRDEAHRFAITFHRSLQRKHAGESILDHIPGIGPKRKASLLLHFGSFENLKKASVEEIATVEGMNRKTAERLKEVLGES